MARHPFYTQKTMRWALLFSLLMPVCSLHAANYCFGFLNAHPERAEISKERADEIQAAHLAHMSALAKQGHLIAAGPMATPGGPRGIVVYQCQSIAQAVAWTEKDPAVVNKRLSIDMHLWNAPDGLGEPLASALKANPEAKYTMVQLPMMILRKTEKAKAGIPQSALKEHLAFFDQLRKDAKVRIAGPFVDSPAFIGVAVLTAMKIDEAKALFASEPLVRDGYAALEPHIWYVADEAIPKP
jgi:uncharacterized protein YciI